MECPSTQTFVGPSTSVKIFSLAGSDFIPELKSGTNEWREAFILHAASEINSAIASYISTELMPYCLKLSHGDLNQLLQKCALEVRFSFVLFPGSKFLCRYMIRLSSRCQYDTMKLLLWIP